MRASVCGPGEFVTQCTVDMARAQKTVKAPTGLSDQVSRALREGALYFFGALALGRIGVAPVTNYG